MPPALRSEAVAPPGLTLPGMEVVNGMSGTDQEQHGRPMHVGAAAFGDLVRSVGTAARAAGLAVPAFRSPPRAPGANRTIRRLPGGAVVSVRIGARPSAAVACDLVDGVIAANALDERAAARVRAALLRAVVPAEPESVGPTPGGSPAVGYRRSVVPSARVA